MLRSIGAPILIFHVILAISAIVLLVFEKRTRKVGILRRILIALFIPIAGPLYSLYLYLFLDPGKPSDRYFGQSSAESDFAGMDHFDNNHP